MTDKKKALDELKGAVRQGEGFEVEKNLSDEDLEGVSGGLAGQCLCKCGIDFSCGGGGGGGSALADEESSTPL
ncbi:MAG: hypothetical protein HC897_14270 [Thermoanaerobaculia bacterium]|nr:hypothetical protein [Thermoanaerobaculia bacterium]